MSFTLGIKLDDSGFENVDLRYPELGNPGIGGTSFEEIFLAKEAANRGIAVKLYHTNNSNFLPGNIQDRCINNVELCRQGLTDVWLRDFVKHYFIKNGIKD